MNGAFKVGLPPFELEDMIDPTIAKDAPPATSGNDQAQTPPVEPTADETPQTVPEINEPEATEHEVNEVSQDTEEPKDDETELKKIYDEKTTGKKEGLLSSKKEEVKPEPKAEPTPTAPVTNDRDKDLPTPEKDPHIRPKFANDFKAIKSKVIEARNQLDAERKAKADLELRLKQLEDAAKKPAELPKDIQEKLASYEQRIRELDISKSPEIQSRYDAKIVSNIESIIDTLKGFGLGVTEDGKEDKKAIDDLKKSGITFKTIKPYADKLREGGYIDEAETIEELLRDNVRTARARESEIASWKTSYESKAQERQQAQKREQDQFQDRKSVV